MRTQQQLAVSAGPNAVNNRSKTRGICALAFVAALSCLTGRADAIPIRLSAAQFASAIAGQTALVEDFESFATGSHSSPLVLANGTYTASLPFITTSTSLCPNPDQCLVQQSDHTAIRTFSAFPSDTKLWGVDLKLREPLDVFQITVVGGSGTLTLTSFVFGGATDFIGFRDDLGLTSVSFQNGGHSCGIGCSTIGNFGFDNVTVPEPATVVLLGLALAGIGATGRPRRPSA